MQSNPTNSSARASLAHALDAEFRRVAQQEEIPMAELVAEVAGLIGRKERQVYNYRTGKWAFDAELIPIFCRRFQSCALVNVLAQACAPTRVVIPEPFDLTRRVSETVRADLRYYERFLDAFESDGIQPDELAELRENAENVVRNVYGFVEIAAADCERRQTRNPASLGAVHK